jgi:hypothetical protein
LISTISHVQAPSPPLRRIFIAVGLRNRARGQDGY